MTGFEAPQVRAQLRRLGQYLIKVSGGSPQTAANPARLLNPLGLEEALCPENDDLPELVERAKIERRKQAKRAQIFPADTLSEPAWDILVDLFAKRASGLQVSFASACLSANVPASAVLRSLCMLENEGLLFRRRDRKDRCCIWLDLTDLGMDRMCAYFRQAD